jgi:DNA-binding transcriptional LysR family regulator
MFFDVAIKDGDMNRTLDLSSLRSFVAVADTGGVTRAANVLNLTQSAVSMQMKRLENALDVQLLDRSARSVGLTAAGEQLLGYARRMLDLNDDAVSRLTDTVFEGIITLGVPHDIVYPYIPSVLRRFNAEFPRVKVHLISAFTRKLREQFERGECDLTLATEDMPGDKGMVLSELPLVWVGAPGGSAWRSRPLRLAFEPNCMFRGPTHKALDDAGIEWEMVVEADSTRTIEASISADLAVNVALQGTPGPHLEEVAHGGYLPPLPTKRINLYVSVLNGGPPRQRLVELLRNAYQN